MRAFLFEKCKTKTTDQNKKAVFLPPKGRKTAEIYYFLRPPHIGGVLENDKLLEERHRLFKTFLGGHQRILVLDADDSVIAGRLQLGEDVRPHAAVVAVAHGAEFPRTAGDVAIACGVQHTRDGGVERIDLGVLCVHVVDGTSQVADGRRGVDALPEEVAGVKVGTDDVAHRLS